MSANAHQDPRWHLVREGDLARLPRTADGYIDLRRIRLSPSERVSSFRAHGQSLDVTTPSEATLKGARVANLDASGSQMPDAHFVASQFQSCRFDNCSFPRLAVAECWFSDCSFTHTKFRDACLSMRPENGISRYDRCDFSGAVISGSTWGAVINDCVFSNVEIRKLMVFGTAFHNCRFSGKIFETNFASMDPVEIAHRWAEPNDMRGCDFSECVLEHVSFRGISLPRASLPRERHLVIMEWPSWSERVLASIAGRSDRAAKAMRTIIVDIFLRPLLQPMLFGVLYTPWYVKEFGFETMREFAGLAGVELSADDG